MRTEEQRQRREIHGKNRASPSNKELCYIQMFMQVIRIDQYSLEHCVIIILNRQAARKQTKMSSSLIYHCSKKEALAIKAKLFPAFRHHQRQHITDPTLLRIVYTIQSFRKLCNSAGRLDIPLLRRNDHLISRNDGHHSSSVLFDDH